MALDTDMELQGTITRVIWGHKESSGESPLLRTSLSGFLNPELDTQTEYFFHHFFQMTSPAYLALRKKVCKGSEQKGESRLRSVGGSFSIHTAMVGEFAKNSLTSGISVIRLCYVV